MKKQFSSALCIIAALVCLILSPFTFAAPHKIPSIPLEQKEEGFLWKKNLHVKYGGQIISLEDQHGALYTELDTFTKSLKSLKDVHDLLSLIQGLNLEKDELVKLLSPLKRTDKDQVKLMSEVIGGLDEGSDINAILNNKEVEEILAKNLESLKKRNACMGSLTYIKHDGSIKETQLINPKKDNKTVIFLSGIGNEIIRILERSDLFNKYSFITFRMEGTDDHYVGIEQFYQSIYQLYKHTFSLIPKEDSFYKCYQEFYDEALHLYNARDKIKKLKGNFDKIIKEVKKAFSDNTKNLWEAYKDLQNNDDLREFDKKNRELFRKRDECFESFKKNFCDSEQALRYFLYSYLNTHVKQMINEQDVCPDDVIILNIHSQMDPCKYCTNALALECFLRDADKIILQKNKQKSLGFFQELYHHYKGDGPEMLICVSSQKLESEGGVSRRILSGRNYPAINPLSLIVQIKDDSNISININPTELHQIRYDSEGSPISLDYKSLRLYFRDNSAA